ncbi:TIGR01457 family HAD-type hydrolase [Lactobacillus sp. PV034]|uniref:TIGR01457 family HAD-type hydrolase n=1 Tax=Lactobacillus sp. PV034 TaxID=2594495 RepID=UPI00223FE8C7|nr:TIGR01457 family HAD-type hydrolase [Lactobacillus sp. PV034]QNQ81484.1 TIGR01457 family HAD-type hydrolase [Lactobacillus sp. PV034]
MKKYNAYLIDLDGTIYRGSDTIDSGVRFVKRLQEKNIPYLFLTNNTTRTPEMVVAKLKGHGIETDVNHIYTPVLAAKTYLKEQNLTTTKIPVYLIGEQGLINGFLSDPRFYLDAQNPKYVIVGMDTDLTYKKVRTACRAIRNGATFIGTNADKVLPAANEFLPGNGSQCKMIEEATGQKPIYIGKPASPIIEYALQLINKNKDEVVMVGDNYQTDIKAGMDNGLDTILTLTGVSNLEEVEKEEAQPTYIVKNMDDWKL